MAKDYFKVEPDRVAILGKHFTPGRGGRKIRYITRHHTAGVLNADQINNVWMSRPASAHYLIDPNGVVSQHVWDANTAWSNANSVSNQESITIEHSNSAGPAQDWPINPVTVDEGARWAAALCLYYGLGRPNFGTNIRDHREFTSTSCPYHLANGGKYHARYMQVAQEHYDWMVREKAGQNTPAPAAPKDGPLMALNDNEQRELLTKVREVWDQLRGPAGKGWEQLGKNADGANLTLVDAIAAVRRDITGGK